MPLQSTLGSLTTFKLDPGEKEGFITLITGTNFISLNGIPSFAINNTINLTGCSFNKTQYINFNSNNNLPNVTFVSTYQDSNSNLGAISSRLRINANNISLISTENVKYGNSNIRNIVIRTIDNNNSLLSSYANPPNSSNANASLQIVGNPIIDSNNNIIIGFTQTLPDLTPNSQPIVKSFSSNGSSINWTKDYRISNNRCVISLRDFSSNKILATTDTYPNDVSIFDISSNGNIISNTVSFVSGLTTNVVSSILDAKIDNNSNRYAIITNQSSTRRNIIKLNGNSIVYQIKGNLNNSTAIFRSIAVSGNNLYTISDNIANALIDPRFINIACFDIDTGNNVWQKNIRVANATSTYCSGKEIQINANNIYITGELSDANLNAAGSFLIKLPESGHTLYNFYNLGNSGYTLRITDGNNIFSSDNLGVLTTPANITINNANLVNTFTITDSTNTTQSWSYTSTQI